ncbi:hypothetical protein [Halovenus marina]|uniref:hypothetical protein n=1 Tax=Halovenus marina TaxID=3396621 RepID=UPI003F564257
MTRTVTDVELRAYKPQENTAFATISNTGIQSVDISERAQGEIDQGSITIDNTDGTYDDLGLTTGDRLEFDVALAGGGGLSRRWTAIAKPPTYTLEGARRRQIEIPARDFVFATLSWRQAYNDFEDRQIAGSDTAILDRLLVTDAPEIDRSQIATVAQTTDLFLNGRDLRSVIVEDLAPIADAVVAQDGTSLVFEPLSEISVKHPLTPGDFRNEISISGSDDDLITLVRVDGGTDYAVDDEQTTQSTTTRVTETDRLTTRINTRKSEVDRVEVYTQRDSGSSDKLVVRLQADDGGAPIAINDRTSDIATKELASDFLDSDGLTTFILPDHTLPPDENPWLIVEATGSTGHDVGTDGSGNMTYTASYPYPLLTRARDSGAADEYRRRDERITDDSLGTFQAVQDKATSRLRHATRPAWQISGEAESLRAHRLTPGDVVDTTATDWQGAPVDGAYIVTERATSYDAARLTTDLTLQEASSL